MNTRKKYYLSFISIIFFSAFFSFLSLRAFQYYELKKSTGDNFLFLKEPIYTFDSHSGYRYLPSKEIQAYWLNNQNEVIRVNQWITNQWGYRDLKTYRTYDKSKTQIAVLGDSLSTSLHNNTAWPNYLENQLNSKNNKFQITNFSRDGIGLEQFPSIVKNEILPLNPDIILINFITADIYRAFVWRERFHTEKYPDYEAVLNCTALPPVIINPQCHFAGVISGPNFDQLKSFKEYLKELALKKIPLIGLSQPHFPTTEIEKRSESLRRSSEAIKKLYKLNKNIIFLHLPVYQELLLNAIPNLTKELMELNPNIRIQPMIEYYSLPKSEKEIQSWINHPTDMHFNDLGAEIYAEAVYRFLKQTTLQKN